MGQKSVKLILQEMVKQDKVPTGLLFTGVRGAGKTTSGRILAAALNCEDLGDRPCGACPHCKSIFEGNSLDVREIDAASHGRVDDIRQLTQELLYSVGGSKRVVLLDEAHSMSRDGQNALLKTLEEPPQDTVFILLTTEPGKLLETVVSRLMSFEYRRITTPDIVTRLAFIAEHEGLEVDPELLLVLAERSNGGMRDAVMTLDQVTRVGVRTVDDFAELMGESDYAPSILKAMLASDLPAVFGLLDQQLSRSGDANAISSSLIHLFRDLIVLQGGGEVARQGDALQARKELSASVDTDRLVAGLRALWDLKTKVRMGDDSRAILDLAAVMVTENLVGKVRSPARTEAPKRLSLADMQKIN